VQRRLVLLTVGGTDIETKFLLNGAFKLEAGEINIDIKQGVAKMILKTFAHSQHL
jgi:hypothetical protein